MASIAWILSLVRFVPRIGIACGLSLWCTSMAAYAQDKVITLQGDTLQAYIPDNPQKQLKLSKQVIGHVNDVGFRQVVVVYPGDSVRIETPATIKGFVRKEMTKYLGSGYFESRNIAMQWLGYRRSENRAVFLQRVCIHHDFSIWYYRESSGTPIPEKYFLLFYRQEAVPFVFATNARFIKWAKETPPFDTLVQQLPLPKPSRTPEFSYLQEVNRLYKEATTPKEEPK